MLRTAAVVVGVFVVVVVVFYLSLLFIDLWFLANSRAHECISWQ